MLTDSIKRDVTLRLHKIFVKYTVMAGYYYDSHFKKFVSLETYHNWSWLASYYVGQMFQASLALYIYFINEFNDIPDDAMTTSMETENINRSFVALTGFIIWVVVTQLLSLGSVAIQYRSEMIESMNQIWIFDEKLKLRLHNVQFQNIKSTGSLLKIICWISLLFPTLFLSTFFHPGNPLKGLFETIFEVSIIPDSPLSWAFAIVQTYGVFLFTGPVVCFLNIGLLTIHQCQQWLEAATPIDSVPIRVQGQFFIQTRHLGILSLDTLVWLYKSTQLLMGVANLAFGKIRLSYHALVTVVLFVLSTFILMRYHDFLFMDGSLTGYSGVALLMLTVLLAILTFFAECFLLDRLEKVCLEFKCKLIEVTKGNHRVIKENRALIPFTLKATYPFCVVNKSTFLEWCNVCVNNLVTLLVL